MRFWKIVVLLGVVFLTVLPSPQGSEVELPPGIVLVEAESNGDLHERVFRPGDIIYRWERLDGSGVGGEVRTILDWIWLKQEQAPRGRLRFHVEREGERIILEESPGLWQGRAEPRMPRPWKFLVDRASQATAEGDGRKAVQAWNTLRQGISEVAPDSFQSWVDFNVCLSWIEVRDWDQAKPACQVLFQEHKNPSLLILIGRASSATSPDLAQFAFQEALALSASVDSPRVTTAYALSGLGKIAQRRKQLDEADQYYQAASTIYEKLAPNDVGYVVVLHDRSFIAQQQGRLLEAQKLAEQELSITKLHFPATEWEAFAWHSFARLAFSRGEYAVVNDYEARAMKLFERQQGSEKVVYSLILLGTTALRVGELDRAAEHFRKALEVDQGADSENTLKTAIYNNLGRLESSRGNLEQAEKYYRQALAINQAEAPDSLSVATNLTNLGNVAVRRGNLSLAEEQFQQALAIKNRLAPQSLTVVLTLGSLAQVNLEVRKERKAIALLEEALPIQRRLAPGSQVEAYLFFLLGVARHRMGERETAQQAFQQALDSLEQQVDRLGASPDQASQFRARFAKEYQDYLDLLLDMGQNEVAFHVLERYRARALLALLAERDLVFADVPADLEARRREIAAQYDRVQQQLVGLPPGASADKPLSELRDLRRKREEVNEDIRQASPRLADLRQPRPLTAEEARAQLDPGTVLLSYSVGEEETHLFVLSQEHGLQVTTLPVGEAALRRDVEAWLPALRHALPGDVTGAEAEARRLARQLYGTLLESVEAHLARGERLLILPDGPLHRLPWGALLRPTSGTSAGEEFLVEWKPLHLSVSATVYAQLRKGPTKPKASTLVALGDPYYPPLPEGTAPSLEDPVLRFAVERGGRFAPLPATATEVKDIAALYPGNAKLYLGKEATEEQAKAIGNTANVVHIAAHGRLDERFPLNSALVLSIPEVPLDGRDNGLLQVWEIFEQVRLDADLVVLSACESALGEERSSEGLMGLTRAFHYAGARSVAATLWSVQDQATADLMVAFHRHLRQGRPKDEALRAAQLEMIHGDHSAPYYWAGVQLYGGR